ncbi:hypothetical protein PHYPSEUDO_003638 [Phytophthora pseudosyringae]|uniref:Uncharacterized protein n=1 Tax=Phytophthora pseudosyringae TaxID=221518 RepID=A0A8T1VRA7_9STRA|nr:hypothetical protein PHYPSEUDO_003638 [Phytophthora pseudosyringae]
MPQLDRCDQVRVALAVSAALSEAVWGISFRCFSRPYAMTDAAFSPFWGVAMNGLYTMVAILFAAVVVPTMIATIILLRDKSPFNQQVWEMRALRRVTIYVGGCFLFVVIVANADAFGYEKRVMSHEAEFSAKFNAFYCKL